MNKSQTLNRNRMLYQVAQPLSIKTQPHSLIRQPFERQSYLEGDTMIVQLPTGKHYVDPDKSYLSLKLRVFNNTNTTCEATFGGGSMANLIRNIRIFHKSGTKITSGQHAHIWYKARDYAEKDTFWFETVGAVQGYNTPVFSITDVQFKMKLSDLHGFFKGHGDKLLPPEIIRDLRIEIDLNPTSQVFQRLGSFVVDGYVLDRPEIQLGLVNVMDNASANINNMATKGGLFWTYDDFFVTSKNFSNTENDVVLTLDKAVSNACKAVTVIRNQSDINNITSDGYNFLYLLGTQQNPTRWTYTVGTDMYPYKKKIDEQFDAYTTCIDCFKSKHGVNLSRAEYFDGNALHVTCLETDDYLENSGIFLNTNQKLEFQLNKSSTGNNIQITTCLQHVNLLRVNSTNSRVDN